MKVFESATYQEFVTHCLDNGTPLRPKSTKRGLAEHLKCHSTYVSHVVAEKAHFSPEQALRFCHYFGLDEVESTFFLDMVQRDRAGDTPTKDHYDRRLEAMKEEWLTVSGRLESENTLDEASASRYFESWILQAVHLGCMLDGIDSESDLVSRLGLDRDVVSSAVFELKSMGLVEESEGVLKMRFRRMHLDRSSPNFRRYHANWRFKTVTDVSMAAKADDIHYTSLVTISRECVEEMKKLILQHIETSRQMVVDSKPEELYMLATDFYRIGEDTE